MKVSRLRCEYLENPRGMDELEPRLSWMVESTQRGAKQVAYRIRVSSSAERLADSCADLWDSGRVETQQSTHIPYQGSHLKSRSRCYWHVQVWNEIDQLTISETAHWTMGLLTNNDWSAQWIAADSEIIRRDPESQQASLSKPGTPALFRKEFSITRPIKCTTLYASARGVFEIRANGTRISEDVFAPEWTDYNKRIHYKTYDVTPQITNGDNAIALTLGDGWWSGYVGWQETRARYGSLENSFIVQLEIEFEDGEVLTINSDDTWLCNTGPIIRSDFMMGEFYDARREHTAWDCAGFDQNQWLPSRIVEAPMAPLVAQRSETVQVVEKLIPISVHEIKPGVFIYDLGQNIAGWVHLTVSAKLGTRLTIRHGERLNPNGSLYTKNLRRATATDIYICKGGAKQEYQPHFTFHGFQYIELSGLDKAPPKDCVVACVLRSANAETGSFECSNEYVNRLWLNGLWSQKDNFLSVPTDCPQRDERLGWMGDAQVFLRTASYNMDVAAFFTKWMIDIEDAQTPEGIFPDTAPRLKEGDNFVGLGNLGGAGAWADAGLIIPYSLWRIYGDTRILERHYAAMVRWIDWLEKTNPDGLRVNELANNYGDWLCIPADTSFGTHSPMKNLLATAYWADDCNKLAQIARALGKDEDSNRFQAMFEKVRSAFQKEWLEDDGRINTDTQTGYLLALAFDLLPNELRKDSAKHLVNNIKALDWHLSTGFVGISHLNPQLSLAGHNDVAYKLLLQKTYPSWLYPVLHGATTIWERWDGWTEKQGFFNPHMNSFNHYSLGSVGEWLFRHVAGIDLDEAKPGFQEFVLKPYIGDGLDYARASYHTMHGEISSDWQREGDILNWTITIPANTSATVSIPCASGTSVYESEKNITLFQVEGLQSLKRTDNYFCLKAKSGKYHFKSTI